MHNEDQDMDSSMDSEEGSDIQNQQNKKGRSGNFKDDPEKAREAGKKGGKHQGQENNPGNFANDREKAVEAGRRGGSA